MLEHILNNSMYSQSPELEVIESELDKLLSIPEIPYEDTVEYLLDSRFLEEEERYFEELIKHEVMV